jgi:hypothetical protein
VTVAAAMVAGTAAMVARTAAAAAGTAAAAAGTAAAAAARTAAMVAGTAATRGAVSVRRDLSVICAHGAELLCGEVRTKGYRLHPGAAISLDTS